LRIFVKNKYDGNSTKIRGHIIEILGFGQSEYCVWCKTCRKDISYQKIVEELGLPYLWLNGDLPDTQEFLSERNLGK
jgi:hypothetical protein